MDLDIGMIMVIVLRGCVIIDLRLARARGQSPTYPDPREREVGEFCISSLRSSGWIDKQKKRMTEVKRLERMMAEEQEYFYLSPSLYL